MGKMMQKAVDALAGLVERNGQPTPEAYAAGREALADLRGLIAPVGEVVAVGNEEGGSDGNA